METRPVETQNVPLILFDRKKEGVLESNDANEVMKYDFEKQMPMYLGGGSRNKPKKGTKCYKNVQTRKKLGAGTHLTMDKKGEIDDTK